MKTIEMNEAKATLAEYVKEAANEPVIVTEKGKPIAALVPVDNADMETIALSNNPEFIAIIERSRRRQKVEGGISSKEMPRRLGLKK